MVLSRTDELLNVNAGTRWLPMLSVGGAPKEQQAERRTGERCHLLSTTRPQACA